MVLAWVRVCFAGLRIARDLDEVIYLAIFDAVISLAPYPPGIAESPENEFFSNISISMSPKLVSAVLAALTAALAFCLQGCASETSTDSGPFIGQHSDTTISEYTRAGVSFPGR